MIFNPKVLRLVFFVTSVCVLGDGRQERFEVVGVVKNAIDAQQVKVAPIFLDLGMSAKAHLH